MKIVAFSIAAPSSSLTTPLIADIAGRFQRDLCHEYEYQNQPRHVKRSYSSLTRDPETMSFGFWSSCRAKYLPFPVPRTAASPICRYQSSCPRQHINRVSSPLRALQTAIDCGAAVPVDPSIGPNFLFADDTGSDPHRISKSGLAESCTANGLQRALSTTPLLCKLT